MTDEPVLRSRTNPLVKRFRAARAGREPGLVLLEGERLIGDALASGFELEALLLDADRANDDTLARHPAARRADRDVLAAVSELKTPPGALALAAAPPLAEAATVEPTPRALLVVLAEVFDPGNLGACARVAEAGGATAIGLAGGGASPYHPRALRGSMGSLLRLPLVQVEGAADLARLGWRSVVAATRDGQPLQAFDWSGPIALWLTGETGRAELDAPADPVTIPMAGAAESLNVATAAALLVYASGRVGAD